MKINAADNAVLTKGYEALRSRLGRSPTIEEWESERMPAIERHVREHLQPGQDFEVEVCAFLRRVDAQLHAGDTATSPEWRMESWAAKLLAKRMANTV